MSWQNDVDLINVCNVYKKTLINAFVIFVNVYYRAAWNADAVLR